MIYIFSDGFADQFGGEKGKKFKYTRFRELLLSVANFSMVKQKGIIENTIGNWMIGESYNFEQIDDISVVGFKV